MDASSWKERLAGATPDALAREIDVFETEIGLRRQGKIEEKLFAETRLRRGVYGQRYDNGQRHDGEASRALAYPCGGLTKGPDTVWDAPGMQRIKIPFGKVSPEQLEVMAELAEEYSDSILHVTTRQDIQLHFVHIEDTPDLMRRLAAVGITTREACGNSVRNVTACPYAGVCAGESFDVSPYAHAVAQYLLGHPDVQDFGRKFKIAFSGCSDEPCGVVSFHDLGGIAVTRARPDGTEERGFALYVGGGLGAVPQEAKRLYDFVGERELLEVAQAVSRVFARLGEKHNRARARIKFLVKKLGVEEFRRLVDEERAVLEPDRRWTEYLDRLDETDETPLRGPGTLPEGPHPEGFDRWRATNCRPQRQPGYVTATVVCPLGDFTADQARALAAIARRYAGDTLRLTVEQNVVLRWVSLSDLPALHADLRDLGLADAGASTITDLVTCPGTDTCKLGISSSRGMTAELRRRLHVLEDQLDPAVRALRIKSSGCFNSCGQHHVADIGFLGVSRNVSGRRVPHFQLVLGGEWSNNGGAYGLAIGAVPSKNVPEVVERVTGMYVQERQEGERFPGFVKRIGRAEVRRRIEDLAAVPSYEQDRSHYSDWGDPREYTIGDMGVGECAGEIVPFVQFGLTAAEREVFEAQVLLEGGHAGKAAIMALDAMITAAKALVRHLEIQVGDGRDEVVEKFRAHLYDPGLFKDTFAGGKFAHYLFHTHQDDGLEGADQEKAHHTIEEAQLFIEAAYGCYESLTRRAAAEAVHAAE